MTRIAFVIPSMSIGGTERQLLYLLGGLRDEFELTLVCTDHEGAFIGDARRIGTYVRSVDARSGWDYRMERQIRHIFRIHRPDVMHTFMFGFDYFANRAARAAGVPVIISSRRQLADWKAWRHRFIQQRANKLVDCVVANSNAVADFAAAQEGLPRASIRVIHNGVDPAAYASTLDHRTICNRYRIHPEARVVGIVANFSPVKDHDLFLAAARQLLERHDDVHFLFVGGGPGVGAFKQKVRAWGIEARCTRTATVSEVADLYRVMDVKVLCSKAEGFPNALVEAMAAGVPVVATAVGGIPELVRDGETGVLVHERTADALAAAIDRVLSDPARAKVLAAAGQRHVTEHLSVGAMVGAYRELYRELLARKRRSVDRG